MIASGLQMASRRAKVSSLSAISSNTASMTKSAEATASSSSTGVMRARRSRIAASLRRPLLTVDA